MSSDNDPLFEYHRWQANLRVLDIDEIKTITGVPIFYPFVKRLIGTLRREFLDHILCWNAIDLESKLGEFRDYYNHHRVHASLKGSTPAEMVGEEKACCGKIDDFRWRSHCRVLVQLPIAA